MRVSYFLLLFLFFSFVACEKGSVSTKISFSTPANCYMVHKAGLYSFNAQIIGNGNYGLINNAGFHTETTTINPKSVGILWQEPEDLISHVDLKQDSVFFVSSSKKGNALIAVFEKPNCEGDILWSWHIWGTEKPKLIKVVNSEGKIFFMMDRNLGAIDSKSHDATKNYGLFYQWGRKDPLRRTNDYVLHNGSLEEAIMNPCSFCISYDNYDWGGEKINNYLWGNPNGYKRVNIDSLRKTIYDPSPAGFMIPPAEVFSDFSLSKTRFSFFHKFRVPFLKKYSFYTSNDKQNAIFFPLSNNRRFHTGRMNVENSVGSWWTSSPDSSGWAICMYMLVRYMEPLSSRARADGNSVRCIQITE